MELNEAREVIRMQDVKREYAIGDTTVYALRGISFTIM